MRNYHNPIKTQYVSTFPKRNTHRDIMTNAQCAMHLCSLAYLCTYTQTHRLPGLCHSAAVTATALRAPSHSQLLLGLTPIKVVCEFPKTRHLSSLLTSTSLFCHLFPFDPFIKRRDVSGSVLHKLLRTRVSAFYLDSAARHQPRVRASPRSLIPLVHGT